ncbi:MAG: hypothetical protein ACYTEQ_05690 [Planctomycetota bacterium]|jgi:DNA-directed RNA polymerase subunit RPC12/RpoP
MKAKSTKTFDRWILTSDINHWPKRLSCVKCGNCGTAFGITPKQLKSQRKFQCPACRKYNRINKRKPVATTKTLQGFDGRIS